jgi:hypothetical protein
MSTHEHDWDPYGRESRVWERIIIAVIILGSLALYGSYYCH